MDGQPAAETPSARRRSRFWWGPIFVALAVASGYQAVLYSSTPALVNSPGLRLIGAPLLPGVFAGLATGSGPAIVAGGFMTLALAWYAVFEALRCMIFRERHHRVRAYVLLSLAALVWLWAGWVTINWNLD